VCLFRHICASQRKSVAAENDKWGRLIFFFYENGRNCSSKKYIANRYADAVSETCSLLAGRTMEIVAEVATGACQSALAGATESSDLGFLPKSLTVQCQSLIERYHELHGYACLPDTLWKARLGPFIESHRELQLLLRKASTTRSAKRSNEGFVRIATRILSLEILATSFAGWSAIYPEAGLAADAILRRNARSLHMPLMEFYLYPPKHISSAAIAALVPPPGRQPAEADLHRPSGTGTLR
jgi:hypothetical protein